MARRWHTGRVPRVTVRYWAGARRAAGYESESLDAATFGELREALVARPTLTAVCQVSSFLIDGVRASDESVLYDGATVDVLPPFAGG